MRGGGGGGKGVKKGDREKRESGRRMEGKRGVGGIGRR